MMKMPCGTEKTKILKTYFNKDSSYEFLPKIFIDKVIIQTIKWRSIIQNPEIINRTD